MTSGFSRSPLPRSNGPRDEIAAVNGAGTFNTIVDCAIDAVAPGVAAYVSIAA